jgi:hypothetical protein
VVKKKRRGKKEEKEEEGEKGEQENYVSIKWRRRERMRTRRKK